MLSGKLCGRSDERDVYRNLVFRCRAKHHLLFARIKCWRFRVLGKNGMDATEASKEQQQQSVRWTAGYVELQSAASGAEDERGDCQWLRSVLLQRSVAPSRCTMSCTIFEIICPLCAMHMCLSPARTLPMHCRRLWSRILTSWRSCFTTTIYTNQLALITFIFDRSAHILKSTLPRFVFVAVNSLPSAEHTSVYVPIICIALYN